MFKVKVFASHRPIGWMRVIHASTLQPDQEAVVSPSLARATRFDEQSTDSMAELASHMAAFVGPETDNPKKARPPVTFQMVRI